MPLASISPSPTPSVSARRGIAFGLAPPFEDSRVLVVRSPSFLYVDIRFAVETSSADPPFRAFAGIVKYIPLSTDAVSAPRIASGWTEGMRGQWFHPIDSLGKFDDIYKGDLFLLGTGDDQIEFGTQKNTITNEIEFYKEYWMYPETPVTLYPCLVIKLQNEGKLQGMFIRVGNWAQGIRQSKVFR